MKVIDAALVKGIGPTITVVDVPKGVKPGCMLHQGNNAWKITGIGSIMLSSRKVELHIRPEIGTDGLPEKEEIFL